MTPNANGMKIIVTVRTRNEERNIARFCQNYGWADQILVADGGSEDDTVAIAEAIPGVQVRQFTEFIELKNGYVRTHYGRHINFLIDWATDEGADWIIFDDCDCWPNHLLQEHAREFFRRIEDPVVMAVRLYLWGDDEHFPRLAQPVKVGQWEPSLWAWQAAYGLRAVEKTSYHQEFDKDFVTTACSIMPPLCLLHNPWPNEQETNRKLTMYRDSGRVPNMAHPLEFGGPLEPLPEWAYEWEVISDDP